MRMTRKKPSRQRCLLFVTAFVMMFAVLAVAVRFAVVVAAEGKMMKLLLSVVATCS
jgi:hypothetical protein